MSFCKKRNILKYRSQTILQIYYKIIFLFKKILFI